jgi:hypothetical protein
MRHKAANLEDSVVSDRNFILEDYLCDRRQYSSCLRLNEHVAYRPRCISHQAYVSVMAYGTQVRGFKPCRSCRIFKGRKILSTPSFGREVKPWVPCRRFAACKRSLDVPWKSTSRQNCRSLFPPISSKFCRWSAERVDRRGGSSSSQSWNV